MKLHATECQSEKINTKFDENRHSGVFPYGKHDGEFSFCFWHNVLPDSGSAWNYMQQNAKVRKSIQNATKIGTRGFFHTANTMATLVFVFGITFSLIQGQHETTCNRMPKWENQYTIFNKIRHSEVFDYDGFKSYETNRFCDRKRIIKASAKREPRAV